METSPRFFSACNPALPFYSFEVLSFSLHRLFQAH